MTLVSKLNIANGNYIPPLKFNMTVASASDVPSIAKVSVHSLLLCCQDAKTDA